MAEFTIEQCFQVALNHHRAMRLQQAQQLYRQILVQDPNHADAWHLLGVMAAQMGQNDSAVELINRAIGIRASFPEAHCNLGNALKNKGQLDQAINAYRQAIALNPNLPEAHTGLGNALRDIGQLDDAIAAHRRAISLEPNLHEGHLNLGIALKDAGQLDEAIAAYRQAIAIRPGYTIAHSSLVYALHFHPAFDARVIAEEHRNWNRRHAEPLKVHIKAHTNCRSADRRLRIGYLSPDFRDHVVGMNLLPLLLRHDRREFDVICYSQVLRPDAVTGFIQKSACAWRHIVGQCDETVTKQIVDDRIDILVDTALHMANNRLQVFARKPAPVQVTFAGYPASTGLNAIDYRLSDQYLDPPGMDDSIYSEKTIRLPDSFWCYEPRETSDIPVNPLPALEKGVVTFGCLNNFGKINAGVVRLWAQVLRQVEKSRLLLLAPQGSHRQRMLDRFSQEGIDPERIAFIGHHPRRNYLESYHRIDVGLDTFPYNGHTTSLDSFWMGVPVVTLTGETAVSRAGWSQLSNLRLTELAAQTPGQFVQIAVRLAGDLPQLRELRATLRKRMEDSAIMNAPKFTASIEAAYRQMWRTWCETVDVAPNFMTHSPH